MTHFTDIHGRRWEVEITVGDIARVRDLLKLDLVDFGADGMKLFDKLSDPVTLVDVLYLLCQEQAKAGGITDVQFGRSMRGDVLEEATDALLEALADFFPKRRAATLRTLKRKLETIGERILAGAEAKLDDPALDEAIARALGEPSGSLPDTSASTPAPSH